MSEKTSKQTGAKVIKRLIADIEINKTVLALFPVVLILSVVPGLYIPVLAGKAIDCIEAPAGVDFAGMKKYAFMIILFAAVSGLFQWLVNMINNRIAYRTVKKIRERAFEKIQRLQVSYIDAHPYGEIVSRMINDTEQMADGLILGFSQFFTGAVTIVITLAFMMSISVFIAIAVVLLTPVSLFTAKFISAKTYKLFHKQSEIRGKQTGFINEMLQNQKTVIAFSYEDRSVEEFDRINQLLKKCSVKAIFYSSLTNPTTRFINNLIYATVGLCGGIFAMKGLMTVGAFVSFLAYATQYTKPFNEISGVLTELQNAFACAERIYELIDEKEQPSDSDKGELSTLSGSVEFCDVTFSYDKERAIINKFNFKANPGEKIAIVGPTGCGKTTLINLLMRFYETSGGEILIDGKNINDIKRRSLRENFGMVLQDTWILNGTVKENIAFGKPDASEEEIVSAAKAVKAHGFITRLKNGYDTKIGGSDGLSEGERQLLCIARVMLMKPKMLILDEATSSIDTATELKVQQAFSRLMQGRTSFVVAHRLSTVVDADKILVMKDGRVFEEGKHEYLLKKGGFYAEIFNSQFLGISTI